MNDETYIQEALADERVMTLLLVGSLGSDTAALPIHLGASIESRFGARHESVAATTIDGSPVSPTYAPAYAGTAPRSPRSASPPRRVRPHLRAALVGTLAGAALAVFGLPAATSWQQARALGRRLGAENGALAASPRGQRDALAMRPGSAILPFRGTADGDVVWNSAEQRGFMRLRGLAVNDVRVEQYQLWIFDAARDERYPVDGGVFDVDAATGDVIVPIAARLPVREATVFAVTLERPGGVVVSKRDRIVLTAKRSG